jgi:uncharacterized phage-associated protein
MTVMMDQEVAAVRASADDVAAAIVADIGPLEAMKLQKLLYYSQAWHLAITNEPLFDEDVEAWTYGPVVNRIWQGHRRMRTVREWRAGQLDRLAGEARDIVALVCAEYGSRSGDELSLLTHGETPWREARGELPDSVQSRARISQSSMAHFYREHRTLGGRSAADLAVGGVHIVDNSSVSVPVAEIREKYRSAPRTAPADTPVIGCGQFETLAGVSFDGISRTRARSRD